MEVWYGKDGSKYEYSKVKPGAEYEGGVEWGEHQVTRTFPMTTWKDRMVIRLEDVYWSIRGRLGI